MKTLHIRPGFGRRLAVLLVLFVLLATLALARQHALFGHHFGKDEIQVSETEAITRHGNRTVVNTALLVPNVTGYKGPVPLTMYMTGDRIDSLVAQPNQETPSFFERTEPLLHAWDGLTVQQAADKKVDGISGATFSSKAIIANAHAAFGAVAAAGDITPTEDPAQFSWAYTATLLVALAAAICPFFIKNRRYRLMQQLLNVAVLGFWTGTFLDYALFIRVFADGLVYSLAGVTTLLLFVVAFIYPLFGRPGHYCAWVCPFGALQDLAGDCALPRITFSRKALRYLRLFRRILWGVLMLALWTGIGAAWIDYEIFGAFLVKSASIGVLVAGCVFIGLALFIPRPFCRFVCPVGTLLKIADRQ